ncbi:OSTA/TMEM184 family protein [archaeon]|nr:MAG: OSTA/TMEM184 family protein [archaeon]
MSDHSHNTHPNRRTTTWAEFAAKLVTITGILFCVVGIIGYSIDLYRHGKQKHFIGWFSSAGFVLLTIPISMRLIVLHLTHYNLPHIQKYVVRIIWMIPIYAVESWLALRFKSMALYLEKLRESYESYVIFCFFYYLIALLGDEHSIYIKLRNRAAVDALHHKKSIWDWCNPFLDNAELLYRYVCMGMAMAMGMMVKYGHDKYGMELLLWISEANILCTHTQSRCPYTHTSNPYVPYT